jgi:hypothetical protein
MNSFLLFPHLGIKPDDLGCPLVSLLGGDPVGLLLERFREAQVMCI